MLPGKKTAVRSDAGKSSSPASDLPSKFDNIKKSLEHLSIVFPPSAPCHAANPLSLPISVTSSNPEGDSLPSQTHSMQGKAADANPFLEKSETRRNQHSTPNQNELFRAIDLPSQGSSSPAPISIKISYFQVKWDNPLPQEPASPPLSQGSKDLSVGNLLTLHSGEKSCLETLPAAAGDEGSNSPASHKTSSSDPWQRLSPRNGAGWAAVYPASRPSQASALHDMVSESIAGWNIGFPSPHVISKSPGLFRKASAALGLILRKLGINRPLPNTIAPDELKTDAAIHHALNHQE